MNREVEKVKKILKETLLFCFLFSLLNNLFISINLNQKYLKNIETKEFLFIFSFEKQKNINNNK